MNDRIEPDVEHDYEPVPEEDDHRRGRALKNRLFKTAMVFSMFVAFGRSPFC